MSIFRPAPGPQQPRTYFTPGQQLGIPVPRMDAQMAQIGAYYRQRVEIQQPQVFKTAAGAAVFVPAPPLQPLPFSRWALEWIVENYWPEFTPGQPLGAPQPRQSEQTAAYFRPREQKEASEQAQGVVDQAVTAAAPVSQFPRSPDQTAAYWRPRVEIPQPVYSTTPGQPLGTPIPRQSDQSNAIWRARIEIQQPASFAPQAPQQVFVAAPDFFGFSETAEQPPQQPPSFAIQPGVAPSAFVPSTPLQQLAPQRWPLEWIVENYSAEFTPGQPLGVPIPRQTEQTAAYWRQRVELWQPIVAGIYTNQSQAFIPANALLVPQAASWRFEWLIDFLQPEIVPQAQISAQVQPQPLQMPQVARQRNDFAALSQQKFTAALALGVPQPRQTEQTAAYYRQHFEIQQPVYFSTRSGFVGGFNVPRVIVYESGVRTTYLDGVRIVYVGAKRTS